MPTQEDRVLSRIKQTLVFIRDHQPVSSETIEAWAYSTLGIRPRTVAVYVQSLIIMKNLMVDPKTKLISVI